MTLSAANLEWLYARDGAEPFICLAVITGPELGTIRLARNTEDVVSRGDVFSASWFDITEPTDTDEQPRTGFMIPNIDRQVGLHLMEAKSGLVVHFEFVRASAPDTVLYALRQLKLRVATITPITVEGELTPVDYGTEPYVPLRISPSAFPGLYRMRT